MYIMKCYKTNGEIFVLDIRDYTIYPRATNDDREIVTKIGFRRNAQPEEFVEVSYSQRDPKFYNRVEFNTERNIPIHTVTPAHRANEEGGDAGQAHDIEFPKRQAG